MLHSYFSKHLYWYVGMSKLTMGITKYIEGQIFETKTHFGTDLPTSGLVARFSTFTRFISQTNLTLNS